MAFGYVGDIALDSSWNLGTIQIQGLSGLPPDLEKRLNLHRTRLITLGWEKEMRQVEESIGVFGSKTLANQALDAVTRAADEVIVNAENTASLWTQVRAMFGENEASKLLTVTEETKSVLAGNRASIAKLKAALADPKVSVSPGSGQFMSVKLLALSTMRYSAELADVAERYAQSNPGLSQMVGELAGKAIRRLAGDLGALAGGLFKGLGVGTGILLLAGLGVGLWYLRPFFVAFSRTR